MQSRMVALYTVLSQHAPNEHYLSDDDQGLVYVRPCMLLPAGMTAELHAWPCEAACSRQCCWHCGRLSIAMVKPYVRDVPLSKLWLGDQATMRRLVCCFRRILRHGGCTGRLLQS